jgi:hypothetical protein
MCGCKSREASFASLLHPVVNVYMDLVDDFRGSLGELSHLVGYH